MKFPSEEEGLGYCLGGERAEGEVNGSHKVN